MSSLSTVRGLCFLRGRASRSSCFGRRHGGTGTARSSSSRCGCFRNFLTLRLAVRAVRAGCELRGQLLPPSCGPSPRYLKNHLPWTCRQRESSQQPSGSRALWLQGAGQSSPPSSSDAEDSRTYSRTSASSSRKRTPRRADGWPFTLALAGGVGLLEGVGNRSSVRATSLAGMRTHFVRRRAGRSSEELAFAAPPTRAGGSPWSAAAPALPGGLAASARSPTLAGGPSSEDVLRVARGLHRSRGGPNEERPRAGAAALEAQTATPPRPTPNVQPPSPSPSPPLLPRLNWPA